MTRSLAGQVALVTGCGSPDGIGAATARCLARDGATVIVSDRVGDDAAAVAATIQSTSSAALDVADGAQIDRAVAEAVDRFGRLDILVNNAASLAGVGPFLATSADEWDLSYTVNLRGPALLCQRVLPIMIEQAAGVIVNLSSTGGLGAEAGFGAYTAMKHGVVGLSKTIAAEFGPAGVRCLAVCPGYVATGMHEAANARLAAEGERPIEDIRAERYEDVALRRAGTPAEVAELIAFVCSPAGAYLTGVALPITGGTPVGL